MDISRNDRLGSNGAGAGTGPGRPRRPETHRAILDAVGGLLAEGGYGATSVEAVARRAKVGKQTIYRWWPARADLVLEYLIAFPAESPLPDEGSLEADLRAYLTDTLANWTAQGFGPVVAALMAEAQNDHRFREIFFRELIASRRAALWDLLARGQMRGELAADRDLGLLADLIYGPIWYRLLLGHAALDERFVRALLHELRLSPGEGAAGGMESV